MLVIRRCDSLPLMRIRDFSTTPVCVSRGPVNLVPALEEAGFTDLFPLEFAEWILRSVVAHFLSKTDEAAPVYSDDVTSWIGESQFTTAQNTIAEAFSNYFDNPDGRVVLLVALYYVTSHPDRFTLAKLNENIVGEMVSWNKEDRLSETVRYAVLLYASAVWLASTWLLDDVEGEKSHWEKLVPDEEVQRAERNTRSMLKVLDYRLFIDQETLDGWVYQTVERFPFEYF